MPPQHTGGMTDTITVTGVVGTLPKLFVTSAGVSIVSFRLASTQRRFDRVKNEWSDGETNWYSISTFRQLAANTLASVSKGERVVVIGRLRIKEWSNAEKSGLAVEIDADAVGHDLAWGASVWRRTTVSSGGSVAAEGGAVAGDSPDGQSAGAPSDSAAADQWAAPLSTDERGDAPSHSDYAPVALDSAETPF